MTTLKVPRATVQRRARRAVPFARTYTRQWFQYDVRQRLTRTYVRRDASPGALVPELGAVTRPLDQSYTWDAASNLTRIRENRLHTEWPDGYRPVTADILHDALYRVANVQCAVPRYSRGVVPRSARGS